MTAKQYLKAMYYAQLSIRKKEEKIKELQELATTTGAIRYDRDRVISSTPQSAGFENKAVRIVDMQRQLREEIADLADMYETGCRIINSLEDVTDNLILEMRYINHMKFSEIAVEMNYSVDAIYYRHRNALDRLKDIRI